MDTSTAPRSRAPSPVLSADVATSLVAVVRREKAAARALRNLVQELHNAARAAYLAGDTPRAQALHARIRALRGPAEDAAATARIAVEMVHTALAERAAMPAAPAQSARRARKP